MRWLPPAPSGPAAKAKRALVLFLVAAVPWVPGGVALAMLISGEA